LRKAHAVVYGLRRVVCELAATKALQYKAEANCVSFDSSLWVIAPRLDSELRRPMQIDDSAPPRDLMRQLVRLETTTTRQNCGENPR
jgi:hypothetical protein